ncbi:hypothetical protein PHYSODRAFT_470206 [Phytophthora sojae]|uniref:PiggyBac transposable element-derived protein domain-containing protein n=1 Tax=Phytophthora sojae (strain P6497) TaxID=1094619 RepID=G4YR51_PHYSP|nr:hypothetical protein PHYSODRAFT_470206 [Phytophthora sojae]EGZ30731.1 hypothetical protein PHYSODRAFT_470206 [Phytophthora sojae]|eukprot:XP_009518006.1 hypothetical protein PHYSODRAFT_470206 [Phytophthora sojae]
MQPYEDRPANSLNQDYTYLYSGESGPTAKALDAAETPSGAFFYFLQPDLWEDIASESNDYFKENMDERVECQHTKQVARQLKHPEFKPKTKEQLRSELENYPGITPRELCVFIGLLIARSIVPNKEKLAHHWRTTGEGAIPRGCFGQFMVRDRFMHLSRSLHFSSNSNVRASGRRWACLERAHVFFWRVRYLILYPTD